jgi:hypothetical protein
MRTPPRRARRGLGAALLTLSLATVGCATGTAVVHDLRLEPIGDTLYVFARSSGVSRNFCVTLGGDVNRAEARLASADTRTIQLARVTGCHTIRHVIVCAENDPACVGPDPLPSEGPARF